MLLVASSPYAKRGELYAAFRRHYGKDDTRVLVWKAPTQIMNPVLQPTKSGEWGTGDLAGLARLGMTSGCLKVPSGRVTVL